MNFGNSFWNTSGFNFDEVLSRENLTLDDLLDEENVLLEVKNSNDKLISFLTKKKEVFEKLVRYVIEQPDLDLGHKKCYKFPYVASEIFSCENGPLLDAFFFDWNYVENQANKDKVQPSGEKDSEPNMSSPRMKPTEEHTGTKEEGADSPTKSVNAGGIPFDTTMLAHLLSYLDQPAPLDETLTGYFQKVMNALMTHRMVDVIRYIIAHENVRVGFQKHNRTRAIADLISKLIAGRTSIFDRISDRVHEDERLNFAKDLIVKNLTAEPNEEPAKTQTHTAFAITQALSLSPQEQHLKMKTKLMSEDLIQHYLTNLKNPQHKQLVRSTIQILEALITAHAAGDNGDDTDQPNKDEIAKLKTDAEAAEQHFIKSLVSNFEVLQGALKTDETKEIKTTFKQNVKPFGIHRIEVVKFISKLYQNPHEDIQNILAKSDFLPELLDLMKKHEWNNLLHNAVYSIIEFILSKGIPELKAKLIEGAKLIDRLKEAVKDTEFTFPSGKYKTPHGFFGYTLKICYLIQGKNEELKSLLPADWAEFYSTTIQPHVQKENQELGKVASPKVMSPMDDDSTLRPSNYATGNLDNESLETQYERWKNSFEMGFGDEGEKKKDEFNETITKGNNQDFMAFTGFGTESNANANPEPKKENWDSQWADFPNRSPDKSPEKKVEETSPKKPAEDPAPQQ